MAAPGRIIDGRYVVEAELGSGGMGVVLRVRHRFTGAQHALKMLRPDFALDIEAQNRFLAEARAATAIGHHGIVQVLDAGKTPEGELYLVMELLSGQPLRTALTRNGIAPAQLRQIGLELLDALGAAHARGFVHRDLKPENVFLVAPHGTAKLLDFGIAKIAQGINMTSAPRTAAGVVLGTLAYMAPEQLHDARSVDLRADLWALGVMFFEMTSGRLPWPARSMTELYIALESEEPTKIQAVVPNAAPPVVAFFARALARDPRARFQSTAEMAAALAALPLMPIAQSAVMPQVSATLATGATGYPAPVAAQQTPYPPQQHTPYQQTPYPPPARTGAPSQPPPAHTPYPPAPIAPTAGHGAPIAATLNHGAPAAGHRSKTLIAIGLAVVAVGLIVTAAVIATRGNGHTDTNVSESKPPPEKHIVEDRGIDITPPQPARQPDPEPTPAPPPPPPKTVPKKVVTPAPAPQPTPAPTPTPTPAAGGQMINGVNREQFCAAVCQGAAACGFNSSTCMKDCAFNQQSVSCVSGVKNCNDFAGCIFDTGCNAKPVGGATCGQTMACQANCGNNAMCACKCAGLMAINHAQLLLQLDMCVASCGNNQQCLVRCKSLGESCLGQ